MNGKELMESMGYVDEQYIAEAEEAPIRRKSFNPLMAIAPAAACLALILAGVWSVPRLQKQTTDEAPMAGAAVYQAEAALGTARMAEDNTAPQAVGAAPMMASGLTKMTVQVVAQTEDALVCIVTDPGSSDYQVDDQVKIALQEEAEQPAALDADAKPPQYEVSFLPDPDAQIITPAQWNLLEDN